MADTWSEYEKVVEKYCGPLEEIDFDEQTWLPKPRGDWQMARQYDDERWEWESRWRIRGRLRWRWRRPELFSTTVGQVLSHGGKTRDVPCWRIVILGFEIERFGEGYPR